MCVRHAAQRDEVPLSAKAGVSPPTTKPTSTLVFPSPSFVRLSRDPCDSRIFDVTPLRARILRYDSATARYAPTSGPLVVASVLGGTEFRRTNAMTLATRLIGRIRPMLMGSWWRCA